MLISLDLSNNNHLVQYSFIPEKELELIDTQKVHWDPCATKSFFLH